MNLLKQINDFFGPDVQIAIEGSILKISIGTQTMDIQLPVMAGCASKAPLSKS